MKQWNCIKWIGIVFVLVAGTLSHFLYEWSGQNYFAGLISPVNESVWEHMKLIFFPMLAFTLILLCRYRKTYPCAVCALLTGILTGTLLIPVLFYAYTFVVGKDLFFMDIAIFIFSTLIGFLISSKIMKSCHSKPKCILPCILVLLLLLCFIFFTYAPPDMALFSDPAVLPG